MKTLITLEIEHRKPIESLADLVAGRAYTLDNVTNVTVVPMTTEPALLQAPRVLTAAQQEALTLFLCALQLQG
jgi:hypothetical protein